MRNYRALVIWPAGARTVNQVSDTEARAILNDAKAFGAVCQIVGTRRGNITTKGAKQ